MRHLKPQISVIVTISESNTKYIGCFLNDKKDDDAIVVPVTLSITVHLVNLSITLCFILGNSLSYHNNRQFSTKDRDNDNVIEINCAALHHGAWWYGICYNSNLNGKYFRGGKVNQDGIVWYHWKRFHSLKRVNMKIRPNPV